MAAEQRTAPRVTTRRAARGAEPHRSTRSGWLRAAVLGANDGMVSTASLVLGVAASGAATGAILTAGAAGATAGALSMAAGEYVSVSSQRDAEAADLALEARELREDPEGELAELAEGFHHRGVPEGLARQVAEALTRDDALEAHAREELGLSADRRARPLQAAWASMLAFAAGAIVPLIAIGVAPAGVRIAVCVLATLGGLGALGTVGARLGGAPARPATIRVLAWGAAAMALTAGVGLVTGRLVA